MKKEVVQQIVKENREIYNRIADQFSSTRKHPWSEFELFKPFVEKNNAVLDVGCGNGRLAEFFAYKQIQYSGHDISSKLIEHAQHKNRQGTFTVGEASRLPYRDGRFDVIFLIATLHHIPSHTLRKTVMREAYRVLKNNGTLIMTEWNLWNTQWWPLLFHFSIKKLTGNSDLDWGDVQKPWKNSQGDLLGYRYLHPFTRGGLKRLITTAGFSNITQYYTKKGQRSSWYDGFNIFSVAKKS